MPGTRNVYTTLMPMMVSMLLLYWANTCRLPLCSTPSSATATNSANTLVDAPALTVGIPPASTSAIYDTALPVMPPTK